MKKKYTISISVMAISTILLCFKFLDSSDYVKIVLGIMSGMTIGFIGKKYAEKD